MEYYSNKSSDNSDCNNNNYNNDNNNYSNNYNNDNSNNRDIAIREVIAKLENEYKMKYYDIKKLIKFCLKVDYK